MGSNRRLLILMTTFFVCIHQIVIAIDPKTNDVEETIEFLRRGEQLVKIDDNYRDIILLTGNTGTGKSTLSRFIAGNLADLTSEEHGEFLIKYRYEGVIGNSTTQSQTIYPDLLVDETNVAFYDCPGYYDTRNMSIEMAATYFMKKVVDHSVSLKLVLVANYDSIRTTGSRKEFTSVVEQTQRFLKNLTGYHDSIALVATKVDNQYVKEQGKLVLRTDEQMVNNIVVFLEDYRQRLLGEEKSTYNDYTLELIDILLKKSEDGKTYQKIALFRKPDEAGPLDKIESMVEGRRKIRDMLFNHTTYAERVGDEFGYTISEASRIKLIALTEVINQRITAQVRNINKEIEDAFRGEERKLGNLVSLTNRYQTASGALIAIREDAKNLTGTLLVARLIEATNVLRVEISREYLNEILDQERYISFITNYTTDRLPVNPTEWVTGLKDCIDYLEETKNWFKFLSDIYDQYSQYEFRRELTKYNVSDVNDWNTEGKAQGIYINSGNFWTFVQKQKNAALIKNQTPTEFQLTVLNNLLNITIRQVPVVSCEADNMKLVVKGDFIRTSEINVTQCGDKLERLHIFALHTVFVDSDINAVGLRLNLSVIAPKWYIDGDRTFNLSAPINVFNYTKAADSSTTPNRTADAGGPGKPGGNSGNFIGIGFNFVNGDKLTVSAIAGNGSNGQDGGNGLNATDPDVSGLGTSSETGKDELDQKLYRTIEDNSAQPVCQTIYAGRTTFKNCKADYTVYANCGAGGGDGGKAGQAGLAGLIEIFELGSKSSIVSTRQNGIPGLDGKGGNNGTNPKKVSMQYIFRREYGGAGTRSSSWSEIWRGDDDTCGAIKDSVSGGNSKDWEAAEKFYDYEPAISINEFQAFVRENQKNSLKTVDLIHFVNLLHNSSSILANYSTKGFVNELQTIEDQFYSLHNEIDLAAYYYSISNRIERFVGQVNASQVPQEQLKVFNYLYAAAWSKYLTLNTTESLMVIDVTNNLIATKNNINEFKASARIKIIDDKRKAYRADIDTKISEASGFIKSDIIPAIANISKSIDGSLKALVAETVEKEKEAAKDKLEYAQKAEKLRSTMDLRMLFGAMDVAAEFGSCLGPQGAAAGAIAGGVSQIGRGFLGDTGVGKVMVVPEGVKTALDGISKSIKKRKEDRIAFLDAELKKIQKKAADHPETLADIEASMNDLIKTLDKERTSPDKDQKNIDAIEEELGKVIDSKEAALKEQKDKLSDSDKAALKTIENINNGVKVFKKSIEAYKQFADDLKSLGEIEKAYNASSKALDQLRQFEQQIYNTMWPMVDDMRQQIEDAERGLSGQSHAALGVKKWKIQSMIRDTKFKLQKFTKEFKAQADLLQILQTLDEAFDTLINVYDRIESYYDQEKLGDYIAAIASADVTKIEVSDPELQSALLQLDLTISSNVVLNNYKSAIDTFKQAVFPFAAYYLDQYRLPKNLQLVNTTDNLVQAASKNIGSLLTKIEEYNRTVINGNDKYIVTASFDSRLRSSQPFFEWPSDSIRQSIADLFAGKQISLRADIKQGLQINAVKFNVVELLFRSSDAGRQAELDSRLLDFKIYLTHTGNSYYRCGASYYVIDGTSQQIMYSFEKSNGVPVQRNNVYDKLQGGTVILSPYTMWTIKLENATKDPKAFEKLSTLVDQTDLVLIGHGQYVSNEVPVCGQGLDDYYEVEKTISEQSLQVL